MRNQKEKTQDRVKERRIKKWAVCLVKFLLKETLGYYQISYFDLIEFSFQYIRFALTHLEVYWECFC